MIKRVRSPKNTIGSMGTTDAGKLLEHIVVYYSPVYPEYYTIGQDCLRIYESYCEFLDDVVGSNLPSDRKKDVVLLQFQQYDSGIVEKDWPPLVKELLMSCINAKRVETDRDLTRSKR